MKLNLGCGHRRVQDFVNVDYDAGCNPDVVADILEVPWKFAEPDSVDEARLTHILEHLSSDSKVYLRFWKELYRVCANGAVIHVRSPHWKHQNQFHDPTHVRFITPLGLELMNQMRNQQDINRGGSETPLGLQFGVDFVVDSISYEFDQLTGEPSEGYYVLHTVKPARIRQ